MNKNKCFVVCCPVNADITEFTYSSVFRLYLKSQTRISNKGTANPKINIFNISEADEGIDAAPRHAPDTPTHREDKCVATTDTRTYL